MPQAQAVLNRSLAKTRSGSSFKKIGSSRRTMTGPAITGHMSSGGATGISQFPTATDEARTFRPFAPKS